MNNSPSFSRWKFNRIEWIGLILLGAVILGYGVNLELRTALRRVPRTDLGVFAAASAAVWSGEDLYSTTDWHGWHYQYAPTLAILFLPFAEPIPQQHLPATSPGEAGKIVPAWAYHATAQSSYVGFHKENIRFFRTVALWYLLSVAFVLISLHALASALEKRPFRCGPPAEKPQRLRWWALRFLPMMVCIGSIGADFSRGQVDVLMLVSVALGLYAVAIGADFSAGLWLSFPATIKLAPPFLLLYPFWRRRWTMAIGVIAGLLLALIILPGVILGPKRTVELYKTWTEVLAKPALGEGTDQSRLNELTGMGSTDNQSLLAFIHNWRFHSLKRGERPAIPAAWERATVYVIGVIMLVGIGLVSGFRRNDTPRSLLVIAGLLIGLTFIVSPVAHNFYYLMMLPLVFALLDQAWPSPTHAKMNWPVLLPVIIFMFVDLCSRFPGIGPALRDVGAPLMSLILLMGAGAVIVLKEPKPAIATSECCSVHA